MKLSPELLALNALKRKTVSPVRSIQTIYIKEKRGKAMKIKKKRTGKK